MIATTTASPAFRASHTPDGSATIAGTQDTAPARPRPSPRRSGGTAAATSAPMTTVPKPNPRPRAALTATITPRLWDTSSARAGAPSSSDPPVSTAR